MRYILTVLWCQVWLQTFAQTSYQPLVTASKSWTIKTCFSGACTYDGYYALGDTVIYGSNYTYLNGYHYNKKFLLREDLARQQVFMMINISGDFNEYLIYDFSLLPGDSIYLENPISPAINSKGYYTVDSILSKSYHGVSRRFFYLSANDPSSFHPYAEWIEGIGSTAMINTPGVAGDSVKLAELTCVIENGLQIYSRRANDSCSIAANIGSGARPNLCDMWFDGKTLRFNCQQKPRIKNCRIFNSSGQIVSELIEKEQLETDLSTLPLGVYLAHVEFYNGTSQSLKFFRW